MPIAELLDGWRLFWQHTCMTQTKNATKGTIGKPKRVRVAAKRGAWSSQGLEAAEELKDVNAARVPAKLKGKKSAAIRRAVLSYYRG